jgi:coenzyme F420-reducing hydrogenase beta subunit
MCVRCSACAAVCSMAVTLLTADAMRAIAKELERFGH